MSRPKKWRKVCCLPESTWFGPLNAPQEPKHFVNMTVEEYETIRLIDLERFTQEECARQMNIARTTVQGIYTQARKKLADSMVNGRILKIEGGNYKLCDGHSQFCHRKRCRRRQRARGEGVINTTPSGCNPVKKMNN
ncbi:MAG: DUF134 domain-containing protein [Syntrophomonadaceae bacterium]|jgi:predicted DNA-binding protein (UPF0251 family)|nr:DUF134 domain-containing protein [Syntrophomonadaceae bacterium]